MTIGYLREYTAGASKPTSYLTFNYTRSVAATVSFLKKRRPPQDQPQLRIWWEGNTMHEIHMVPALHEGDSPFEVHQVLEIRE